MNRLLATICATAFFCGNAAQAMDGTFDREAEVQKYLLIITSKTNGEVTSAAKEIYSSGINDDRLAKAVNDRLLNGYRDLTLPPGPPTPIGTSFLLRGVDDEYGIWISRALSSFGISEYASTLKKVSADPKRKGGAKSHRVRSAAEDAMEKIDWHKGKNEIMASKQFHQPGADQHASQLMNLLAVTDISYRQFALDRISRESIKDPRVYKLLADQLARHIDTPDFKPSRYEDNLMVVNVKLLGLSGDAQYRAVLERVLTSNAVAGIKEHAEVALNRLK